MELPNNLKESSGKTIDKSTIDVQNNESAKITQDPAYASYV